MFSSPFPCPLGSQGSVWRPEKGLQTKRTCFVIFPRDETELHQPAGFTDCSFGSFWRWLQHVPFSHPFCRSVSLAIVVSHRDSSLSPCTLGRFQLPQLPQCTSCTAGQQFSCGVGRGGRVQQRLPTKASGKRGKRCWGKECFIVVLAWANS